MFKPTLLLGLTALLALSTTSSSGGMALALMDEEAADVDTTDFGRYLDDLDVGSDLDEGSEFDEGRDADSETPEPSVTSAAKPSVTSAPKPSVTSAPKPTTPAPIPGQQTLVAGNEKCGGRGFNYTMYMPKDPATNAYTTLTCEAGYRCLRAAVRANGYECQEWPSRNPVSFYGQCGGKTYDGQTICAPGSVCQFVSESFSQCLPTY